jgi:hypothetical protein
MFGLGLEVLRSSERAMSRGVRHRVEHATIVWFVVAVGSVRAYSQRKTMEAVAI